MKINKNQIIENISKIVALIIADALFYKGDHMKAWIDEQRKILEDYERKQVIRKESINVEYRIIE